MPPFDPDSDHPLRDALADEVAAPTPINARATLSELLHIDARLAVYKGRRDDLREQLQTEALRRYELEGAAPSWRVARLGTASLCNTDAEVDVNVADDDAYGEWVLNEHPTEADVVVTIPGSLASAPEVMQVAAAMATAGARVDIVPAGAFLSALVKTGRADPDTGQLWAEDGQVVPGVTVTKARPYLRVNLAAEAKERARQQVDAVLDAAGAGDLQAYSDAAAKELVTTLVDLTGDPDADDEGAGDAPPDEDGAEHTSTITIGDPELEHADE